MPFQNLPEGGERRALAYAKLLELDTSTTTMGQLFDRYQLEIIPTKAPATQKGNIKELAGLRHAFAHMRPEQWGRWKVRYVILRTTLRRTFVTSVVPGREE